ncbi:hypothetical protein GCM10023238_34460 [Streptomyces heliomycini]
MFRISVFPSYLNPSPLLALLVAVAVPGAAVLVTLLALRGVVIEPLGVVRTARPARRRLWWRLLLPLAGAGMLFPMIGQGRENGDFNQYLVTGGVVCLLVGVTALLPWIVETVVARLGSGSVSWQLAVRRLQLSSERGGRMVNGIASGRGRRDRAADAVRRGGGRLHQGHRLRRDQGPDAGAVPTGVELGAAATKLERTEGVRKVHALSEGYLYDAPPQKEPQNGAPLTIGDCATLREVAKLPDCRDGDAFTLRGDDYDDGTAALNKPGRKLYLETPEGPGETEAVAWTLPEGVKQGRPDRRPDRQPAQRLPDDPGRDARSHGGGGSEGSCIW